MKKIKWPPAFRVPTFSQAINIGIWIVILFMLVKRIPGWIDHSRMQNMAVRSQELMRTNSEKVLVPPQGKKSVLVFWATWCGPCELELSRLNRWVRENPQHKTSVFAISSFEDPVLVEKVAKDRAYAFEVLLDANGQLAHDLKVKVTPTIVFIDPSGAVDWISDGLTPTLEFRVRKFLQ